MNLYRCSIELSEEAKWRKISASPVYAVQQDKEAAKAYVERHLKHGCKVKKVALLGKALGPRLFR